MSDEPETYRTKSGRVLTDAEIQELADEAERGYNVDHLLSRARSALRLTKTVVISEFADGTYHAVSHTHGDNKEVASQDLENWDEMKAWVDKYLPLTNGAEDPPVGG